MKLNVFLLLWVFLGLCNILGIEHPIVKWPWIAMSVVCAVACVVDVIRKSIAFAKSI